MVSLVLYLLLAGGLEFGRMMFAANALQDVARVTARELAVAPVGAQLTFDDVLACDAADPACLKGRIFDPACLVVDLADPAVGPDIDGYFAAMPAANRALRQLMTSDPLRPNLLRYPGALLSDATGDACSAVGPNGQAAATGFAVGIPLVEVRAANGVETITWVPVVEEIRAAQNVDCPQRGPFSLVYVAANDTCGALTADPVPAGARGMAAIRVNYPYQAAMLSGYRTPVPTVDDPLPPNLSNPIEADDGSVQQNNAAPGGVLDDGGATGAYAGAFGLGRHYALAGKTLRPFRKVISAQAIFRREVFQ